jgi:RNA polymerase sigma factor for flagellar operon FliA
VAISTEDLWIDYAAHRGAATREKIILQYAPLVKYVVGRLAITLPTILDSDDILSYGTIGLMDAIERFDPTRGIKFETYAIARIRGAIIDGLRALDQIPRTTRQRGREIERAYTQLELEMGRPPTDVEVAAHLNLDLGKFHETLVHNAATLVSIDSLVESEDSTMVTRGDLIEDKSSPDPQAITEKREVLGNLVSAVERLPERERLVLALYYNEELTMKEISKVLDVSESRVCQLHSQALARLRGYLREREE